MKLARSTLIVSLLALGVAGCTTYQATLTNAQGQKLTCKASGKAGIVTGLYLRQGFQRCVSNAEAHGYGSSPTSKQ